MGSEDTIYDARYYTPIHFCKGRFNTPPKTRDVIGDDLEDDFQWIPELPTSGYATNDLASVNYARTIDVIEPHMENIDFRVPTIGHPLDPTIDNEIVSDGWFIDKHGVLTTKGEFSGSEDAGGRQALRPIGEWRVNTVCRGMMVTSEGGFKHYRLTIGLDPTETPLRWRQELNLVSMTKLLLMLTNLLRLKFEVNDEEELPRLNFKI